MKLIRFSVLWYRVPRPEKYTIKPERKEIAAVSIDLTRHDDFQGPRKLEVRPLQITWLWSICLVGMSRLLVTTARASRR